MCAQAAGRELLCKSAIIMSVDMYSIPNLLIRGESAHVCACRQLDVSFNRLDSLNRFPELPSLQWLSVEGNELQSVASCPHLSRLTWLSLANNRLTSLEGKHYYPFARVNSWPKIYTYTVSSYHSPYVKHVSNVREILHAVPVWQAIRPMYCVVWESLPAQMCVGPTRRPAAAGGSAGALSVQQ